MFGNSNQESVQALLQKHVSLVQNSLDKLVEVVDAYAGNGGDEDPGLKERSFELHLIENEADDVRREIQTAITTGSFLPFYRQDYIILAELIDNVANHSVDFSKSLYLTRTKFSPENQKQMKTLASAVVETFTPFPSLIKALFTNPNDVDQISDQICEFEQKCDSIEWKLLKKIYEVETDRSEQFLQRRLIQVLSSIADVIEDASDRTRLIVLKQSA